MEFPASETGQKPGPANPRVLACLVHPFFASRQGLFDPGENGQSKRPEKGARLKLNV
jgi:hypothetical protein